MEKNFFHFKNLKLTKLEDKCFLHRIVAKKMGIVYCEYQKGWTHNNIQHTSEEFMYIISGHLEASIGKVKHTLKKGQGVLIPSNTFHTFIALKKTIALVIFAPPITAKQAQVIMKKSAARNKMKKYSSK